ncbi:MAG: polyprenyl synthetase family protein [Myxococcales bacterium]|nr:polyprenyl synthetase family protein [Myxococcales bacterium]
MSEALPRGSGRLAPGRPGSGRPISPVDPLLALVDASLREQLASETALVRAIGEHVFANPGKRLRPTLLMLSAELCGYRGPRRVQLAAAHEMIHTATLLHDDVVDLSQLRRGQPAAHTVWGNRRAVLVGDFFYARASQMIVEDGELAIVGLFADMIRMMSEGELLQLERSFDPDASEAHYYAVIERKSAALLSAVCEIGAILGGVTPAERKRLADFGRELGLAFQMRDDALDYAASADELGKPPLTDLREGKITMPLILALKRASSAECEATVAVLKNAAARSAEGAGDTLEVTEIEGIRALVARMRGVEDTDRRALTHIDKARTALAPFPPSDAKHALLAAADFSVSRRA